MTAGNSGTRQLQPNALGKRWIATLAPVDDRSSASRLRRASPACLGAAGQQQGQGTGGSSSSFSTCPPPGDAAAPNDTAAAYRTSRKALLSPDGSGLCCVEVDWVVVCGGCTGAPATGCGSTCVPQQNQRGAGVAAAAEPQQATWLQPHAVKATELLERCSGARGLDVLVVGRGE